MNAHRGSMARGYRSLVLCRLYITARESGTAIGDLPDRMLGDMGVRRRVDGTVRTTAFTVRIPKGLSGEPLAERMRRLEEEVGEKKGVLREARSGQEGRGDRGYRLPHDIRGAGRRRVRAGFGSDPLEEAALMRLARQDGSGLGPKDIF